MRRVAAFLSVLLLVALAALAQTDDETDDNNFIVRFLEQRISAPGRQIRLHGIEGALSSRARIREITVSDSEGVWLRLQGVEIDWSRLALLRGRVNINRLSAQSIAWLRQPVPPPGRALPPPEAAAEPFSLPELPVEIRLSELALPSVRFAEPVFGEAAELRVSGSLDLAGGALETELDIVRLDQPGGELTLEASFSNATRRLGIDLRLTEPQGGLVAGLLGIEGEPPIELTVSGEGPLEDVNINFALDAAGSRVAEGVAELRGRDDGLGFDVSLDGELAPLVPAQFRDFFAGETSLDVSGLSKSGGGVRIDELALRGAELTLTGGLETGSDGLLRRLALDGSLGDPAGPPVVLPVPGGGTTLQSAVLHVRFGDASRWNGLLVLDRMAAGGITMEDVTLTMGGLARNLDDPARRAVTVNLEGLATGVSAEDPEVAAALGSRIDLFADLALSPGGPVEVRQLQVSGNGLSLFTAGRIADQTYTGRNSMRVADLAIFSGLADRDLGGSVELTAEGSVTPLAGAFDLEVDGEAQDLRLGDPRLDRLLAGATTLSGGVVRDAGGIRTENLRLENPQIAFNSDGQIATARTDIGFDARLSDLALLDPRASGALTATGSAIGARGEIAVALDAAVEEGILMGRTLAGARVGFDGEVRGSDVTGRLSGGGRLDELELDLAADISVEDDVRSVDDIRVAVGPNTLTGALTQRGEAPVEGELALRAPDIAPLAAFALTEASGALNADISLGPAATGQGITVDVRAREVVVEDTARIGELTLDAQVADAFGVPMVQGDLDASDLALAGVDAASLSAEAEQTGPDRTRFSADARLAVGTLVDISGELARLPDGFAATLATLDLRQGDTAATLAAPATVTVAGGAVELTPLALTVGGGRLTAEGRVADAFDLSLAIRDLPLAIADTIRPDLALAGRVNGTARVTGPRDAPDARFDLRAAEVAAAPTRAAGLPPIALDAGGSTSGGRLSVDAAVRGAGGLAATARGAVPLGDGALDLNVELQSFPLVLVDRLAGGQGLTGTVTGRARVTGTLASPAVSFEVRGADLSASLLRQNAIPPLTAAASGSFRDNVVTLASATLTGAQGLDLRASGGIPLSGPGLEVRVSGTAPLALADPVLEQRSAQARGLVRIDATVRGSLAAPRFAGTVTLAGGTLVYPELNVRLENIALDAWLDGDAVTIRSFRASVAGGGSITAEGRVALTAPYPASLRVRANEVRYTDGAFVRTIVSADLTLEGPLAGGGLISGRIRLGDTEISVAEGLGLNAAVTLETVRHVNTPPAVQLTLDRASIGAPETREAGGSGLRLDVRITAPRIFVRGRGLDVELGGDVRVGGTTADVQPVGRFELRRGRILILGQRIEFDEGALTLTGSLDPEVFFVARTQAGDVTAIVTVQGRVSDPEITFSSEPPLPQDEVLARVLFGRATESLSAFQLAQLAAAAAELAGGGGNGLMSQLREATGLDDLDIVTGDDGQAAVRAGKYIDDNIYLDVEAEADGDSTASISLDISERVTARGSVGSDGNTTIGIFFERDY